MTVIKQNKTKRCWQGCGEIGILVSFLSNRSNLKQSQNNECAVNISKMCG